MDFVCLSTDEGPGTWERQGWFGTPQISFRRQEDGASGNRGSLLGTIARGWNA